MGGCGHPDLEIRGSGGGCGHPDLEIRGSGGGGHPDLQIRGSGGGDHPDLEISGGRPVSKKFFSAFLNFRVFIVRDTKTGMRPR